MRTDLKIDFILSFHISYQNKGTQNVKNNGIGIRLTNLPKWFIRSSGPKNQPQSPPKLGTFFENKVCSLRIQSFKSCSPSLLHIIKENYFHTVAN